MMRTAVDQMGRTVQLPDAPRRIVSLVPSQTELLFDLGLREEVVGVTKFCVHPAVLIASKQSVGGTKQFRFDVIDRLQPDLIIGNKEENYPEGIEQLAAKYPVWMSDIHDLPEALTMMAQVGEMVGRPAEAKQLVEGIAAGFARLAAIVRPFPTHRAGYFIWQNPLMAVGAPTFIDDILQRCGWQNVFVANGRYPAITPAQLQATQPNLILLSSEPFPFGEKHQAAFQQLCPAAHIVLVDGEMFSWYGSRLRTAIDYLADLVTAVNSS